MKAISHSSQPTLVVARAAALLMVDASRNGEVIYIADGTYKEIEKAVLEPAYLTKIKGEGAPTDDQILERIQGLAKP